MSPVLNQIDIQGYRVLGSERKEEILVHLAPSKRIKPRCPRCGGDRLRSKGRYQRKVRHLDALGIPCQLIIHNRRFRCLGCRKTFYPQLPGILPGRHSSEPFRNQVYLQHHDGVPASVLGNRQGLGHATVSRIYNQFTERKAAERISLDCPQILGIDEHTLHKGSRFATTFCDLKNHKVFDLVEGKSEAALVKFLSSLKGRDKVKIVCIDLSSPFRGIIKRWFPNAKIVADRFHVIRLVIHHFMSLFRQIAPDIKNQRGTLAALRTNPENLSQTQRQRLAKLFAQYPAFEPIYEQMHSLRTLLNQKHRTRRQCRPLLQQLLAFIDRFQASRFEALNILAKTLLDWLEPIACMWRFTKNNGITEGFHRKMKLIQRRAYGFRNFNNYRLRVIAQCG